MSFLTTDLRNKRNQLLYSPTYRTVAHYCVDTTKAKEMREALFNEELFLSSIRPLSDLLKKNLADTLVNQQSQKTEMAPSIASKVVNNDYSKLSGITNFISGVFSVVSSVVFKRPKSPVDCFDNVQMVHNDCWRYSESDYKNNLDPSVDVNKLKLSDMCDCKTMAASCGNKVRQQFSGSNSEQQTMAWLRCPTNQFIETNLADDCFEDAKSLEECYSLPGSPYIEYFSPPQYQKHDYFEIDAPKTKVEGKFIKSVIESSPKVTLEFPKKYSEEQELSNVEVNNKLVESCEDKVAKLKAFLQQRCKNKTKVLLETDSKDSTESKPTKSIPIANSKSKHFKNPNRLCLKRVKTNMKQIIEDEMLFADEVNLDDFSSVEDSPSFHSLEKWSESPPSNDTPQDYFDEISGRFQMGSDVPSEDSFQIVFSDLPKRVRSTSDCDSEDSFIVFEDSPDSCYTSKDVFCDSDEDSDSDSDLSDSGCGNMKLSQSMSRTVSNLTDDSLYDEVDCMNVVPSSMVLHKEESRLVQDHNMSAGKEPPVKKVHFSPLPPKVHVMCVWAYAARQARAGNWEQYALDRERFRRRIADVELALAWVLKPQHRTRIMFQRFMPWWNAEKRRELAEKSEKNEENKTRTGDGEKRSNKAVIIEEIFEGTKENKEEPNNEKTLKDLQDDDFKSDEKENDDCFKLTEENKQREIIANNTRHVQGEKDDIQKKRKEAETKSYRNMADDEEILHAKVENKLLDRKDKDEHGTNVVRCADKRILKSNGI